MRRPRTSRLIGMLAVVVIVAFVVSTYVSFMDYRDNLAEKGEWTVEFKAQFEFGGAVPLEIKNPSISVVYEKHPGYVSFIDWFADEYSASDSYERDNGSAIYSVHVKILAASKDKPSQTLLDQTYFVHPNDLTSGTLLTLNETYGPFIAYNSTLPLKVSYSIEINGMGGLVGSSAGMYYVAMWRE